MSSNPETAPDLEVAQIVGNIFSRRPGKKYSVWLDLTPESLQDYPSDNERESMLLNMYVDIAFLGCKKLWGDTFTWEFMTREQYNLLQLYMNSLGVHLHIKCNADNSDPWKQVEKHGLDSVQYLRFSIDFLPRNP